MFNRLECSKRKLRRGHDLKTVFTAFVSAIIGRLIATVLFYLGTSGIEKGPRVTINEAQQTAPAEGVDPGG